MLTTNRTRFTFVALLALTGLLLGCQAPAPPAEPAAPDYAAEYGPMIDTVFDVWNGGDYAALESLMSADYARSAPDADTQGIDEHRAFVEQVHATYPDFKIVSPERAFAENLAFVHWIVTGTDSGEGGSGNAIEVSGITMFRIDGGKFVEEVVRFDTAAMLEQLGADSVPHTE